MLVFCPAFDIFYFMKKKILILGGTGHFGTRIIKGLMDIADIELLVGGRNKADIEKHISELINEKTPACSIKAFQINMNDDFFVSKLKELSPYILLHTAGPFQGQSYKVAEACIETNTHYIDLADGRDFVVRFDRLNEKAKAKNLLLVSGASTLPGLSSAVVKHFSDKYFNTLQEIFISIAPAHQTPRGIGTIEAVLSYCGKPFEILFKGKTKTVFGWQNLSFRHYRQFGCRFGGVCDVPDLVILPQKYNGLKTAVFNADLASPFEQMVLWFMALLTRIHCVSNWSQFSSIFYKMSQALLKFGGQTGGMKIKLNGLNKENKFVEVEWDLVAFDNHGPNIPCIPLIILTKDLLNEKVTKFGAMPCVEMFDLNRFDEEVNDLEIFWDYVIRNK